MCPLERENSRWEYNMDIFRTFVTQTLPFLFSNSTSQPLSMRYLTISGVEVCIALMSGVPPLRACALISAPCSTSISTMSNCADKQAW